MIDNQLDEKTIFNLARKIECDEARAEYLQQVSGGDAGLIIRVSALLHGFEQQKSFLESPALGVATTLDLVATLERPGTCVGPYKLLEQIGEGGMGAVYMAEQKEPVRRLVALKVIKPGMDTQQVVARFEAERQALAMMNHPHIAKVLDAGATAAGRPYFVMELVKGVPLTEFCDQQQLDTHQRLRLFITLCQAVQHAHQKGLIHRDLKPSNVLVEMHDVTPVLKVIDFGVAKAIGQQLTEKTLHTGFSQMVGTPLYMSPEQAGQSSIDVDTRSDVYSLGVLLYEILTGHTPFESETLRNAGFDEMRRMIREVDPPRPSARVSTLQANALSTISDRRKVEPHKLSAQLHGELDWIVMKSLEKDRNRRYETASAFAADVQRYLDDEPVQACPPSTAYRLRKLAGKHRVVLGTMAAVGLAMILGTGISVWQAMEANQARRATEEQRKLAEADFDKALKAVDRLLARVGNETLNDVPGVHQLRDNLVDDAVGFYRKLAVRRPDDARVRRQMAEVQIQSWGWKWVVRRGNMEAELQDAITNLEQLYREHPEDLSVVAALGDGYLKLGHGGPGPERKQNFQRGREILDAGLKRHPDSAAIRDRLADLFTGLWNLLPPAEAELQMQEVVTLCQPLTQKNRHFAGLALAALAQRHAERNDFTAALDWARRGIEVRRGAVEAAPSNSIHRSYLAYELVACAGLLVRIGRIEEAGPMFQEAARHASQTYRENPDVPHYRDVQSIIQRVFAGFVNKHGGPTDRAALLSVHNERLAANYIARSQEYVGQGSDDLRMADVRKALELDPDNLEAINEAYAYHLGRGEVDDAKSFARQAVVIAQDRMKNWIQRGEQLQLLGEYFQAIQAFDKAVDESGGAWWIVKRRGVANFLDGRYDAALRDMTEALRGQPDDIYTLLWIDPSLVAACPSEAFRNGMLKLADEAVEVNQGTTDHQAVRGVLRANMGRMADAKVDFDAVAASPDATAYSLYLAAVASLSVNDLDAFRDVCAKLCERFHESQDSDALHLASWTCVLAPRAVENYDGIITLARRALSLRPADRKDLLGLGAVLFRAGQFAEANQHLTAAAKAPESADTSPAYVWYFLAMTNHRLGHHDEAQKWLAQATEFTAKALTESKTNPNLLSWNRRLTLELLDAEAKALLSDDP